VPRNGQLLSTVTRPNSDKSSWRGHPGIAQAGYVMRPAWRSSHHRQDRDALATCPAMKAPVGSGVLRSRLRTLSGSKTQFWLRRRPLVLVDESPEYIAALGLPVEDLRKVESGFGRFKIQAPMRSGSVVVLDVGAEDAF
jgi:hypothetical protein